MKIDNYTDDHLTDLMNKYYNVSQYLFAITLTYLVIELMHMVLFILHFVIRAKRGCLHFLKKAYIYINLPYTLVLIVLIITRHSFPVMVCMCDFKDNYVTLRE